MKKAGWILVGAVAVVATTLLVRRLLVSDRDRVARVVQRLSRHLERRDAASICLLLSDDYADGHGLNRAGLRELLSRGLPQFEWISVRVEDLVVEVTGTSATAEFMAYARAKGRGPASSYRWTSPVRLELRKRDREWRVCRAEYRLPDRVSY